MIFLTLGLTYGNVDVLHGVVGAATNGANGQAVATRAGAASEGNVSARVNSETVVLVLDGSTRDVDTRRRSNIKSICVVSEIPCIASRVVNSNIDDLEVVGVVNGEALHGRVQDVQAGDSGVGEIVGVEELGLSDAAVAALAVPPFGAVAVDDMAGLALHGDGSAGDIDEWAVPGFVLEGCSTGKDHSRPVLKISHIESCACWHGDVLQNDGGA